MNIKGFYRQLRFAQKLDKKLSDRCLLCGSFAELPVLYVLMNPSDIDLLLCDFSVRLVQSTDARNQSEEQLTLCMDSRDCSKGYTRLRKYRKDGTADFYIRPSTVFPDCLKGPAWRKVNLNRGAAICGDSFPQLLSQYFLKFLELKLFTMDYVYALQVSTWPEDAAEWKSRERTRGWPSKSVIQQVVNGGCHLVAKSHPASPNDKTQWRYSFSHAELILIQTWTDVQKYVYHILRIIKDRVIKECGNCDEKTIFCTYFFKTLMFWVIEEKPCEFWNDNPILTIILELNCIMVEWLIERNCRSYFIRDYNLMCYLTDESQLNQVIEALLSYKDDCIFRVMSDFPKAQLEIQVKIPVSYNTTLHFMLQAVYSSLHREHPKIERSLSEDACDSRAIFDAQKFLYDALITHIKFMSAKIDSINKQQMISSALEMFKMATGANENRSFEVTLSPGFSLYETSVKALEFFSNTHQTKKNNPFDDLLLPAIDSDSKDILQTEIFRQTALCQFMKQFLIIFWGQSILPTYAMAVAYKANFYYTAVKDYEKAIAAYGEFLEVLRRANLKCQTYHGLQAIFPIIIDNHFSIIFDEHIQVVMGFILLCKSMLPVRRRHCKNVVLHICPMRLLIYIAFQCKRKANDLIDTELLSELVGFGSNSLFNSFKNYVTFSRQFLFAAVRSSGVKAVISEKHRSRSVLMTPIMM